jgi:hypothetical protein
MFKLEVQLQGERHIAKRMCQFHPGRTSKQEAKGKDLSQSARKYPCSKSDLKTEWVMQFVYTHTAHYQHKEELH